MDNQNDGFYYIRFKGNNDEIVATIPFEKSLLHSMRTLKDMQEDIGGGTQENPFILFTSAITPKDFKDCISFIKTIQNFIAQNPINNSAEALAKFINDQLRDAPKPYTRLAKIIKTGSYLGIDPLWLTGLQQNLNARFKEEKYIGVALRLGLRDINTLDNDFLAPIKKSPLQKIIRNIEAVLQHRINDRNTPHPIMKLRAPIDFIPKCNKNGVFYSIKNNTIIALKYDALNNPYTEDILSLKNPAMITHLNIPTQTSAHADLARKVFDNTETFDQLPLSVFKSTDNQYCAYSIAFNPPHHIGFTIITLPKKNPIFLLDTITFLDSFTDINNNKKITCITAGNKKLLVIDLESMAIKTPLPNTQIEIACLYQSFLVFNGSTEGIGSLIYDVHIFDLNTDKDIHYKEGFSATLARQLIAGNYNNYMRIVESTDADPMLNKSIKNTTHTISIVDMELPEQLITKVPYTFEINYPGKLIWSPLFSSRYFLLNIAIPTVAHLTFKDVIETNDTVSICGFNKSRSEIVIYQYIDKVAFKHIMDSIKNFEQLGIEELFVLETMTTKPNQEKKFKKGNVIENDIFARIPEQHQAILRQFFPATMFPETKKRPSTETLPPAKKQRLEKNKE